MRRSAMLCLRADVLPLAAGVRWPANRLGQAAQGTGEGECPAEEAGGEPGLGYGDPERGRLGKLLSLTKRRQAVAHVRNSLGREHVSERRACQVLGQSRSTQRRQLQVTADEPRLLHPRSCRSARGIRKECSVLAPVSPRMTPFSET